MHDNDILESLDRGLTQAAAGELWDLGSFADEPEDRVVREIRTADSDLLRRAYRGLQQVSDDMSSMLDVIERELERRGVWL